MSWDPVRQSLSRFDEIVSRLGVRIGDDAPTTPQLSLVREFLADQDSMDDTALLAKWNGRDFRVFYDAVIVVSRLTETVVELSDQPAGALRKRLRSVLSGSLTQDFSPGQAKDYFYELEIARTLRRAGFEVSLREPDVVVSGNGLSRELGMACKYPSSEAQIHSHLSKGYHQITNQGMPGCVVIGLDLLVFNAVFGSPPKFLDFRQGDREPNVVASDQTECAIRTLVQQRAKDYPSEPAIDGAILTLGMWGIWGKPAGFVSVTSWALQCDAENPIRPDLERIVSAARGLVSEELPPRTAT